MINIGIIGCGFVGGALKAWLEENNKECKLFISDPPKGYNDDLSGIDIAFLQIHVPTEDDGTQDLTLMKELIRKLPDVPVFVRTTILPGTSTLLTKETGHSVYYMPEFLTERTYIEDFKHQPMVFTGAIELLCKIFKGKTFTTMSPLEAEITKYCHNVFGAYKVTYFNAVYDYCQKNGRGLGTRSCRDASFRLYKRHTHIRTWTRRQVWLWRQMLPEGRQRIRQDGTRYSARHPSLPAP